MIYIKAFENYEQFKELFGVNEHGNGVKSRKNKILLSMLKNKELIHRAASEKEKYFKRDVDGYNKKSGYTEFRQRWTCFDGLFKKSKFLGCKSMDDLRRQCYLWMCCGDYILELNGNVFNSDMYETDDFKGLCEDGDATCIRYVNHDRDGRVFKMKAGKFFRKLIEESKLNEFISEQVKIWLCEDFADAWRAYASTQLHPEYKLHVDYDFSSIYDSDCCKGSFHSCMTNQGYHTFYEDAVDAEAAYLTNTDGEIVARCIIYTNVHTEDDKVIRLAERQYSSDGDESLKRQLILSLISAGKIDGYKRVGADCGAASSFVDLNGNPFPSTRFWIPCHLETGDTVSYQDSFKWWNHDEQCAYNWETFDYDDCLTYTSGELEWNNHDNERWSNYNDEWIDEDDACYVDTRDDYFYDGQIRFANVWNSYRGCFVREDCFEGDCLEINGEYYYAGEDAEYPEENRISVCPRCDEYFVEEDGYYSELTNEYYCCEDCMQEAEQDYKEDYWYYSEYDDEYYEYKSEVVKAVQWDKWSKTYVEGTISVESFNELVDDYSATEYGGTLYIDDVTYDGEPMHIAAAVRAA